MLSADRIPFLGALLLGGLFILSGALLAWLSIRLAKGGVGRNRLMGLRIPSTMKSDAGWEAGQKAFAPWGIAAGVGSATAGLAVILIRPTRGPTVFLLGLASLWLVVVPLIGTLFGDQAAKQADPD